jgi:hypothetical protein
VASDDQILEADVNELSDRLQGGIATCRSVVANYRSLLMSDDLAAASQMDGICDTAPPASAEQQD